MFRWEQKRYPSPGEAAKSTGAIAELDLATQALDTSLETAQRNLRLQPMSPRSTKSADVHHDAIPEQNAIDYPVDVSFAPDFAEMHTFTLGPAPWAGPVGETMRCHGWADTAWVGRRARRDYARRYRVPSNAGSPAPDISV